MVIYNNIIYLFFLSREVEGYGPMKPQQPAEKIDRSGANSSKWIFPT